MKRVFNFKEWLPWEQNASPMLLTLTLNAGMKDLKRYFGMGLWTTIIIFEEGQAKWLFRPKELKLLGQKMIDFLLFPPLRASFLDSYDESETKLLKRASKVQSSINLSALGNQRLVELFEELSRIYYRWYKFGWFCEPVQFQSQDILTSWLEDTTFKKRLALGKNEIKEVLFTIDEETFAVEILRHLKRCAEALKEFLDTEKGIGTELAKEDIENLVKKILVTARTRKDKCKSQLIRLLEEHRDKYYWKQNNYYSTKTLTEEDILKEIITMEGFYFSDPSRNIKHKLREIEKNNKDALDKKKELLKELPSYKRDVTMLASTIGGILLDKRKRVIMITNSAFDRILGEVAKRSGYSLEDCRMLIPQELKDFVSSPKDYQGRFEERKELFLIYQGDFPVLEELFPGRSEKVRRLKTSHSDIAMKEPFIAEGSEAEKIIKRLNLRLNFLAETEEKPSYDLRGTTAYHDPGIKKVSGTVKVIRNPKAETLETGNILVAPSTTPDYMEVISRCSAIVTDWGGLTSHAAIVSRELRRPCIVGTNYASHVLTDGDIIELDLVEGTIKVLEKGER